MNRYINIKTCTVFIILTLLLFIYIIKYILFSEKREEPPLNWLPTPSPRFGKTFMSLSIENPYSTYMISLPKDKWKRDRFDDIMKKNNQEIEYNIWNGVLVNEEPEILEWAKTNDLAHVSNNKLKGNIGSFLAHLTLWDFIARQDNDRHFLILEDNALVTKNTNVGIKDLLNLDYDIIWLTALRPLGEKTHIDDLLKVGDYSEFQIKMWWSRRKLPNIWLSSYLLKPSGARKLLSYFKQYEFDASNDIVDQALSYSILKNKSNKMKAYVINNNKIFGHIETKGDTRRIQNGWSNESAPRTSMKESTPPT